MRVYDLSHSEIGETVPSEAAVPGQATVAIVGGVRGEQPVDDEGNVFYLDGAID